MGKDKKAYNRAYYLAQLENKKKGEIKSCACGCGFPVSKPGRRYISGHNDHPSGENSPNYNPKRHILENRACACGCKETFECFTVAHQKYIPGHKSGKNSPGYRPELHIIETRVCACGCNETFECTTVSRKKYINNHGRKNINGVNHYNYKPENHISENRICSCGCNGTFRCPTISRQKYIGDHSQKRKGENNVFWRGGISFEPYSMDWTQTLRISIRERDHYTCQLCSSPQGDRAHAVHHIDYNKQNCNPANLITLCGGCNAKVNANRERWTGYFNLKTEAVFLLSMT